MAPRARALAPVRRRERVASVMSRLAHALDALVRRADVRRGVCARALSRERGRGARALEDGSESARAVDLRRTLSKFDVLKLGVGGIIGAGVFVLTGEVARSRAGPGVAASYALAAAASAITGLAYAEFATAMPEAGSSYSYAYAAFGEFGGVVTGANLALELLIASAAIARGWTSYALAMFGANGEATRLKLIEGVLDVDVIAGVVVLGMTALLIRGAKETARFNAVVTYASLFVILVVILAGSFRVDPANWTPFAPFGTAGIISGASVVIFSFVGFDTVATCAEEVLDPSADLPFGILGSLGICATLYVVMCFVITGMVNYASIDVNAPFAVAFTEHGMHWVASFISVGAVAAITTSLLLSMMGQPRIFMVMARDGLLPEWFAKVSEKYGTPANATLFSGVVTGIFAVLLDINILAQLVSIGTLSIFCCVNLGLLVTRCTPKDADWSLRAPALRRALALLASSLGFGIDYRARDGVSWFGAVCLVLTCASTLSFLMLPTVAVVSGVGGGDAHKTFRAPFAPFLPALGVLLTCILIGGLGLAAWIRYIVYTFIVTVVYVAFAVHRLDPFESLAVRSVELAAVARSDSDDDVSDVAALLPTRPESVVRVSR